MDGIHVIIYSSTMDPAWECMKWWPTTQKNMSHHFTEDWACGMI